MPRSHASYSSEDLLRLAQIALASDNSREIDSILEELERFRNNNRARAYAAQIRTEVDGYSKNGASGMARSRPEKSSRNSSKRENTIIDAPGNYPPTPEQSDAIRAFSTGENIKINSFAGSGKTSTLIQISHSTPKRGIYLAFNKKIVEDSAGAFPPNVTCSTIHSLAYRSTMAIFANSSKMTETMNALKVAELFELKDWDVYRGHVLSANTQGQLILGTVRKYCQSREEVLTPKHVPSIHQLYETPEKVRNGVADWLAKAASALWKLMSSPSSEVPLGHAGYLKVWALSKPRINADFILVDEAQDTNPVVLGVLEHQTAQLVLVGDRHQQIYEWLGAVNAMEKLPSSRSTSLTVSFRFGPEIANLANKVLKLLGETLLVKGNPQKQSFIGPISRPNAILARTNASTMEVVIESLDANLRPHLVGGTDDLRRLLNGVSSLKRGLSTDVSEFFGFKSWQEVLVHVRHEETHELLTFVNLVESRGESQLLWALGRCVDERDADRSISTVHKSKGRQWEAVRLFNDFFNSTPTKTSGQNVKREDGKADDAELRLLYVALTRAKTLLEIPEPVEYLLRHGKLMPKLKPAKT